MIFNKIDRRTPSYVYFVFSVSGNCKADQGAKNLCRLLHVNDRKVPIYVGQMGPIIKQPIESCSEYHGKDGFGDVPDVYPTVDETGMLHELGIQVAHTSLCITEKTIRI